MLTNKTESIHTELFCNNWFVKSEVDSIKIEIKVWINLIIKNLLKCPSMTIHTEVDETDQNGINQNKSHSKHLLKLFNDD